MGADSGNVTVLQVLPSLVTGGVERGTIEITQAVARTEGWTALTASSGGRLVPAVESAGGRHVRLPLAHRNPLTIWRNAARLEGVIRAESVDIVHARSRAPAWSAWLACQRTRAHFVTTYHGTYGEELPFKRKYNSVMAKGERVIAASRFIADLIVRQHQTEPERIRVIPRGVDLTAFNPAAVSGNRMMRLAQAWRLPEAAAVVLLPGRLTSWKGQGLLIEAMARIGRRDICGVLVGSDQGRHHYSAGLVRRAEALGIADRVRLAGQCDDMPAALMLADVVVHASVQPEAFGRVVIEAQAMGRPVIASDLGGPAETVEQGVTGWRVPPGDASALASAIEQTLGLDAEQRAALAERARAAVHDKYTVGAMQAATLDVYREVIGLA
jgi:glycosyltransferase involved in cell wall biosynthesis